MARFEAAQQMAYSYRCRVDAGWAREHILLRGGVMLLILVFGIAQRTLRVTPSRGPTRRGAQHRLGGALSTKGVVNKRVPNEINAIMSSSMAKLEQSSDELIMLHNATNDLEIAQQRWIREHADRLGSLIRSYDRMVRNSLPLGRGDTRKKRARGK